MKNLIEKCIFDTMAYKKLIVFKAKNQKIIAMQFFKRLIAYKKNSYL